MPSNPGIQMVTVYVGPKRKAFIIHKNLLCSSARFFEAALNGSFVEGQEGSIHLPEDEAGAFSLYVDWVYRGTVRKGNTEMHLHDLYDLYIFAEKLCLVNLTNQTMDAIQDMASEHKLRYELITKELLTKVISRTVHRTSPCVSTINGKPSEHVTGLRWLSIYMLVWSILTAARKKAKEGDAKGVRLLQGSSKRKQSMPSEDLRFV